MALADERVQRVVDRRRLGREARDDLDLAPAQAGGDLELVQRDPALADTLRSLR